MTGTWAVKGLIIAAGIGGGVLLTFGVRWACSTLRDSWRAAAVIRETQSQLSGEPVPYWPACPCPPGCRCPRSEYADRLGDEIVSKLTAILFCPACPGDGECTCSIPCGDDGCLGGFSDSDMEWLLGTGPEGAEQ